MHPNEQSNYKSAWNPTLKFKYRDQTKRLRLFNKPTGRLIAFNYQNFFRFTKQTILRPDVLFPLNFKDQSIYFVHGSITFTLLAFFSSRERERRKKISVHRIGFLSLPLSVALVIKGREMSTSSYSIVINTSVYIGLLVINNDSRWTPICLVSLITLFNYT